MPRTPPSQRLASRHGFARLFACNLAWFACSPPKEPTPTAVDVAQPAPNPTASPHGGASGNAGHSASSTTDAAQGGQGGQGSQGSQGAHGGNTASSTACKLGAQPTTNLFHDDFSSLSQSQSLWDIFQIAPADYTINQGLTLTVHPGSGEKELVEFISRQTFTFLECYLTFRFEPTGALDPLIFAPFDVMGGAQDQAHADGIALAEANDELVAIAFGNGGMDSSTTLAHQPFSSANRWLRFREHAGTTYADTSGDGVTWADFAAMDTPAAFASSVRLKVGVYSPQMIAHDAGIKIGGINMPPN